jgi:NADH-ubiquinone oxidoreductase chain 1
MLLGFGGVAFITLLERKLLGLSQVRLGPNKVTLFGVLQPLSDGVKLLFKDIYVVTLNQIIFFLFGPLILLFFFIFLWIVLIPWWGSPILLKYSILFYFSMLGLGAYAVILTGLSRIRTFSKLGGLRGMLQRLSFEVALILVFLIICCSINRFLLVRETGVPLELLLIWSAMWFKISLMETNRAPFDLLEGERELISGFNIEMGRLTFVFLFLSEYGIIIVISIILRFSFNGLIRLLAFWFAVIILFVRSCFPRLRYDILISLMWVSILPMRILSLIIFIIIK